jgi:hypothetical protein
MITFTDEYESIGIEGIDNRNKFRLDAAEPSGARAKLT